MDAPGAYVLDDNEEDLLRNCQFQERENRPAPTESNMNIWKESIPGPQGCAYQGGVFEVEIVLLANYPYVASFPSNYCPLKVF